MVSAAKTESVTKIHLQDVKITVPGTSDKKTVSSVYWSGASKKGHLKVAHCKENVPASFDFSSKSEIPFGVSAALLFAYKYHADILLRPDDIWIMVCYGLARHISLNAEKLRHLFVDHEGKKKITIVRPETFSTMNWEGATQDFAKELEKEVKGDYCKLIACNFSTTTQLEYVASLVSLMTTMKHYFEYEMICGSGIRNVLMAGTLDDWKLLKKKIEGLAVYDLKEWVKKLTYIVDNFIATFEGKPDLKFWNYMVDKVDGRGGSGMRTVKSDYTGWIIDFYPYDDEGQAVGEALKPRNFPKIILKAPVTVIDSSTKTKYEMKFMTGFSGIAYSNETFSPQLSYAFTVKSETSTK